MTNDRTVSNNLNGITPEHIRTGNIKPGYNYFSTHIIFYIKMDGKFTRKSQLVSNGHNIDAPVSIKYYSVASRDRVNIDFLLHHSMNFISMIAATGTSAPI